MKSLLVLVISFLIFAAQGQQPELKLVKDWKKLDFNFPNPKDRSSAIAKGNYVAQNVFPIDVDVDYRGSMGVLQSPRIFVTTPRFSEGVPVTLGYIKASQSGPLIQPYPDYSWHSSHGANCSGLTSVVRVAIDSCSHMYVLDSGVINDVVKCPPQLLIFNLRNDQLIHRYKFPKSQYSSTSLFVTPVSDFFSGVLNCFSNHKYIDVFFVRFWTLKTPNRLVDALTQKFTSLMSPDFPYLSMTQKLIVHG